MRNRRSNGFTLVELLVVIVIIMLLLSIGVPAGLRVREMSMRKTSRAHLALLESACQIYSNDFDDEFPPSSQEGALPDFYGGHMLCLLLTGYAEDPGTAGTPDPDDILADDGKAGFGFRISPRGRVYGPYNGAAALPVKNVSMAKNGGTGINGAHPAFVDTFGKTIYYYRNEGSGFDATDNNGGDDLGGPADVAAYFNNSTLPFVLCSQGADDTWINLQDKDSRNISNLSIE